MSASGRKNRILALLSALLLTLAFVGVPGAARAEQAEPLNVDIAMEPSYITEPGTVKLVFTLTADASAEGNIALNTITINGVPTTIMGSVSPRLPLQLKFDNVEITEEMLENVIPVSVTYTDAAGAGHAFSSYFFISGFSDEITFLREVSVSDPAPGEAVAVSYVLENRSKVDFYDVAVTDPLFGSIARVDLLAAGDRQVYARTIVPSQDSVSTPQVTYRLKAGGDDLTQQLAPLSLAPHTSEPSTGQEGAAELPIAVTLSADSAEVASGDSFLLVCRVENLSHESLTGLRVRCAGLEAFEYTIDLDPGASAVLARSVTTIAGHSYAVSASGTLATGQAFTALSNTVSVGVAGERFDPALGHVAELSEGALAIEALSCQREGGRVTFALAIDNTLGALEDVSVGARGLGLLCRIGALAEERRELTLSMDPSADGSYELYVTAITPSGLRVMASTDISAPSAPETAGVTSASAASPAPGSTGSSGRGELLRYMVYVAGGFMLLVVVLLALVYTGLHRQGARRGDEEPQPARTPPKPE